MADKIHCVKKTLRLTPAESRLLSEKAEALHMNEAEYLRLLLGTGSSLRLLHETVIASIERRREKQFKFNEEHDIVLQQIKKQVKNIINGLCHE